MLLNETTLHVPKLCLSSSSVFFVSDCMGRHVCLWMSSWLVAGLCHAPVSCIPLSWLFQRVWVILFPSVSVECFFNLCLLLCLSTGRLEVVKWVHIFFSIFVARLVGFSASSVTSTPSRRRYVPSMVAPLSSTPTCVGPAVVCPS